MMYIVDTVIKHTKEEGRIIIFKNSTDLRNQVRPAHYQIGIFVSEDDK